MPAKKYFTEEEKQEAKREALRRWYAKHGKEYHRKHAESNRERCRKYAQSALGKARYERRKVNGEVQEAAVRRYVVCGLWHKIEGYDRMVADGCSERNRKNRWVLHHRLEEQGFTTSQLKEAGMYYHRPPEELIWMTRHDHTSLHAKMLRGSYDE